MTIKIDDESIEVSDKDFVIAKFTDCGNGMEGEIFETDNFRMSASDLIRVAMFLLSKAEERAYLVES